MIVNQLLVMILTLMLLSPPLFAKKADKRRELIAPIPISRHPTDKERAVDGFRHAKHDTGVPAYALTDKIIRKVFVLKNKCNGNQVYIASETDFKATTLLQFEQMECGSGGCHMVISMYNKKLKKSIPLMHGQVRGVLGEPVSKTNCPPIYFINHGGHFDRVGDQSGISRATYQNGVYDFDRIDGELYQEFNPYFAKTNAKPERSTRQEGTTDNTKEKSQ